MLKLIKEIHSHLRSTDKVSCHQTIAYFTNKVHDIYFDHVVWESGQQGLLKIEGLAKLKKQHASAQISKEVMMWIARSLTTVVLFLFFILL